ncbi:SDR family oxidoreductase [Burkholderia multivorans]|uniref:SDR family NAD(P)-dependent oxidoreductase n=1 Tax=Burkholderia multivorans TaxID=87883 RepID=UPI000CFEB3C7|nr:SDR family oxidoreductase [Burkholderia multivorans]AYZ01387.1 SDR family oxidoreductase [Burkholderia multivorans]MBU9119982.1 SDR family oxidoreductase [Burkholderia multivorans]PRG50400.1 NAD(P)-dependent oxidoreductase [Burkholderia multivorans]
MRFKNQVVLVTGSARGIGYQTAVRFAMEGARIVVNDLDPVAVDEAVDTIRKQGGQAIAAACDASDDTQVTRTVQDVLARTDRIDVLVNNAGIYSLCAPQDLAATAWRRTIAVNLDGAFYWSQAVGGLSMLPRRAGTIVNVASGAGLAGIPSAPAYVASKHGLIGLTRALAVDWGPYNIRVNAVCPGLTWTALARLGQSQNPAAFEERERRIPLGHAATLDDQAAAILFLASAEAKSVHGLIMNVDGGTAAMSSGYTAQTPQP